MDAVSLFLIAAAAVLLLGALGEVLFHRTGIPQVLWLMLCGMVLGPVLGVVPRDDMAQLAPYAALPALVMIATEVGGRLRLTDLARGIARSGPLAGLSFVVTVFVVTLASLIAGIAGLLPDDWGIAQSLLLGGILGASCSLITVPVMARSRLSPTVTQPLELEPTLASAFSIVVVAALAALLDPGAQGAVASLVNLVVMLSVGLGVGLVSAALWFGLLFVLQAPSYAYTVTLAALMVQFVVTRQLGGSGLMSVLVSAILLANAPDICRRAGLKKTVEINKDARGYRRLLLFVARSTFFLFVGLMLGAPYGHVGLGLLLGLLLVPARLPAVLVATKWGGWSPESRPLSAVAVPRGMLAGVLALLPVQAQVRGAEGFPITVFTVLFVSSAIFAIAFPFARRKLPAADVVALDVDGEIGASPVSIVAPDATSQRALMPSSSDEAPPTSRSPMGPLPPPTPPPRRNR